MLLPRFKRIVSTNNMHVYICALAKVTSYIADMFESKEATDYLNTNVNHGNDFCSRIIAGGILAAMTPKDYIEGDINGDDSVNLKDLVTIAKVVAKWENVVHNKKAVDVNASGYAELDDVVHLARYLAGWNDVELN